MMHAAELRAIMRRLGWHQSWLARILGANRARTERWVYGREAIPQPIADWLRDVIAKPGELLPPPRGW